MRIQNNKHPPPGFSKLYLLEHHLPIAHNLVQVPLSVVLTTHAGGSGVLVVVYETQGQLKGMGANVDQRPDLTVGHVGG